MAYRADAETRGLWHMEEPVEEGAILVKDFSGNENHLVGGSGVESVEGRLGRAVRFDGTGLVSAADDAALEPGSGNFTIEAWVKPASFGADAALVCKWDSGTDQRSYKLFLDASGLPTLILSSDGTAATVVTVAGPDALPVGEWTHLAAVRSGNTVKVYVNRGEAASGRVASGGPAFIHAAMPRRTSTPHDPSWPAPDATARPRSSS